ncbi:nucleoside diphosphate kinase regulator [Wenxinia marina]|nr:nucleoside diphosphate kinase regulator [Wenxinia marina]GGL50442.1 nucleoside diphosphate kinase regulator [Wenxinia marina]
MPQNQNASRSAGRPPRVILAAEAVDRLEALAQAAIMRNPDLADLLLEKLGRAQIVIAAKLPSDVVSIGRAVTYRDEATGTEKTVTPVFPEDADISRGRISILTPIGAAILGLATGASPPWNTRTGIRRTLTILRVVADEAAEVGQAQ